MSLFKSKKKENVETVEAPVSGFSILDDDSPLDFKSLVPETEEESKNPKKRKRFKLKPNPNPLFKADIEPMCVYCEHGTLISEQEIICKQRGIQGPSDCCKKFLYDPLKRVPPRPKKADFSHFSPEDFEL